MKGFFWGEKSPLERLRGGSHLENECSRQACSVAHTARCSGQYFLGDTKTASVFWVIHSLEQRPKYEELGENKHLSRDCGVSHLENEWSRQLCLVAHMARCSGQYSSRDTKTASVFG